MRRPAELVAILLSVGLATGACGGKSRAGDPGTQDVPEEIADPGVAADPGEDVPVPADPGSDLGADGADDVPSQTADLPSDTGSDGTVVTLFDQVRITSAQDQPNFQNVRTSLHLDGPATAVRLVLDLDTTCFPFTKWATNPPPPNQNYPADCDAYDRNFEVTIDDPAKEGDPPAIELVRAITPFGGPMHVETDVTDVWNGLAPGDHAVRIHISTWGDGSGIQTGSAGGWTVSARLEVTPGPAPRKVLAVVPLWNGSLGAGEPPAPVGFVVPEGTTAGRIEIRATGHGGAQIDDPACIGGAEEFCKRTHQWTVDDTTIGEKEFWTDCLPWCQPATWTEGGGKPFVYCALNPCGNTMSVVASRANWCPGSVTDAVLLDASVLSAAGPHTFAFKVPGVAAGGSWRVSAVYVAIGQ
jgi:hypothetical protein